MLNNLHVKNLALIDEAEIEFGEGLNILSGETGAGKSVVIGSLGLALGGRADSELIRHGAEYALVELSLTTGNEEVWSALEELGISREDEGGELLIQRRIYPGRSLCRVNGETITLKELGAVSQLMIDICGQRESMRLLKLTALKELLDDYAGAELKEILEQLKEAYHSYKDLLSKLETEDDDESLRERKAQLARFEVEEIDGAALKSGEDEELENSFRKMQHSVKIREALNLIGGLCGYDEPGAADSIARALREIRTVTEYDEELSALESMLYDLEGLASDFDRELRSYIDGSEYEPEAFAEVQERLDTVNRLKSKYGRTIELVLEYRDKRQEELSVLEDYEAYREGLKRELKSVTDRLDELCASAHELRMAAAGALSDKLMDMLKDMNFLSCELEVTVEGVPGVYTSSGYDAVDFYISLNPGEAKKPLSLVASGGELSRIMLAVKCATAQRDNIGTMVFDEIDTGISGVTAWKVASRLAQLSKEHQVICITHQAQIAAFADRHFLIEKYVEAGSTLTRVERLMPDSMTAELARMMGADEMSSAALGAAADLKERADREKAV